MFSGNNPGVDISIRISPGVDLRIGIIKLINISTM